MFTFSTSSLACLLHLTWIILSFNLALSIKTPTGDKNKFKQGMLQYIVWQRNQNTPPTDDVHPEYTKPQALNISTENEIPNIFTLVTKRVLFRRNKPFYHSRLLASFGTLIRPMKKVSSSRPVFRYG